MTKANGPLFTVHFRRRKEGRTDYVKRIALLKSGLLRLVIRKSNAAITAHIVQFDPKGDVTLAHASTRDLEKLGFKGKRNVPSAYLLGLLVAKRAIAKGAKKCIADFGLYTASKGNILFAVVKGAVDGGLDINVGEEKLPSKDRLTGKHLKVDVTSLVSKIKEQKV